ncbi:MAG: peptidase C45 [Planctomycetes bacterium]|nr:peptidase C45 [Planctomycetota bacterium]
MRAVWLSGPLSRRIFSPFVGLIAVTFVLAAAARASGETIGRCGQGWLERIDGQLVLHLKGTPYEMGYQHGALLKEHVRSNLDYLLRVKGDTELAQIGPLKLKPADAIRLIIGIQHRHVPKKYFEEMEGLARGSGVPVGDVHLTNFIPELFHCSGFALMNSATKDGTLYHGRVLDYAIDWRLQEHAVIIVAEPEGGIPFVNVSFAGFIGSVTGMNAAHVSIGEMGGGGLGKWDGVPMAFLVRDVLETAQDLDAAIRVFRDRPRTCQYFFVIADAKTNRAIGMEASADRFELIRPGQEHPLLPEPVPDCVLLSADERYKELVRRVKAGHGQFTAQSALRLMDRPVAMSSNLHNVLFEPKSTRFWVAIASKDGQPAATQPYHRFQLSELLKRRPAASAREVPFIAQKPNERK